MRFSLRQRKNEFVVHAAYRVAEHLILVHDEHVGALATQEAAFLGFKRRHHHGGAEVVGDVSRGDASAPAQGAPLV